MKKVNYFIHLLGILITCSIYISHAYGQLNPDGDEDEDWLLNKWEQNGIDVNNDNEIDFILPGSDPLHKDIYVEVDFMSLHQPRIDSITDVVNSFANSPVLNPDGFHGINLHIDVDEMITHRDTTNLLDLFGIKALFFGTLAERQLGFDTIRAKQLVSHYALFAHSQPGTTSSGISNGIPAMEFLVTLGSPGWGTDPVTGHNVGSRDQQAGTFMHELGHNLNLHHGGNIGTNCNPNYLSVMSYARQFSSLIGDRPLDYSRNLIFPPLIERSLDETRGIGASVPIELKTIYGPPPTVITITGKAQDWNGDGDTLDTGIRRDLNDFNSDGCGPTPDQDLWGHDDWNSLRYTKFNPSLLSSKSINLSEQYSLLKNTTNIANQSIPSERELTIGNTTTPPTITNQSEVIEELTFENVRQHRMLLLEGINYSINSLPNTAFAQSKEAQNLKDSLIFGPQNQTGSLANLLQSDKLDEAIAKLNELKAKMDSTLGGFKADDLIKDPQAQQKVLPLIENLILVLEKQK